MKASFVSSWLWWRHNGRDSVSNHQSHSTVYSDPDQRNHQSSMSLTFVRGIHRWPVNSLHKWPVKTENVSIWWRHHVWGFPPIYIIFSFLPAQVTCVHLWALRDLPLHTKCLFILYVEALRNIQYIPRNMHTVLLCFALLWLCNRS